MSTSDPAQPREPGNAALDPATVAAQLQARREKIQAFLIEKWGPVPPPCPYCRIAAWQIDPYAVSIPRYGPGHAGFGVPAFLVWCGNCGHEVYLSAAILGLFEDVTGSPLPGLSFPDESSLSNK